MLRHIKAGMFPATGHLSYDVPVAATRPAAAVFFMHPISTRSFLQARRCKNLQVDVMLTHLPFAPKSQLSRRENIYDTNP
jgi:hypothetical protein